MQTQTYEQAVSRSKEDCLTLTATVEKMFSAHATLQSTLDTVQAELGKKDAVLQRILGEKNEKSTENDRLEIEV